LAAYVIGRGFHPNDLVPSFIRGYLSEFQIHNLKRDGWRLSFENIDQFGLTVFRERIIQINRNLCPYNRDKAIGHEIVHACFGEKMTSDHPLFGKGMDGLRNNIYVEWIGRNIRSSPTLLSCIWREFSIPPRIYDRASLLATELIEYPQLLFPSLREDYNFTLMD
jgi:hypothetical protein